MGSSFSTSRVVFEAPYREDSVGHQREEGTPVITAQSGSVIKGPELTDADFLNISVHKISDDSDVKLDVKGNNANNDKKQTKQGSPDVSFPSNVFDVFRKLPKKFGQEVPDPTPEPPPLGPFEHEGASSGCLISKAEPPHPAEETLQPLVSSLSLSQSLPNAQALLFFSPEQTTESSYRFRCPGPGVFQCTLTGLVFVMAQEAELLYRTVQWDEKQLQSAGKMAAGLLFNIKCSEDAVSELHLPHCETNDALAFDDILSVVHITDDGMSILQPMEITDTHVVVKVPHLSAFGLVWNIVKRFLNITCPIKGQVLLFLRPPYIGHPVLDVFLLPNNIPLNEVAAQQEGAENIRISSDCHLSLGQSYSVHCEPEGVTIQPEHAIFDPSYGPNFYPTFEVFLTTNPEKVTLTVEDKEGRDVWKRVAYLTGPRRGIPQRNVPEEDRVPAEDRLFSIRTQFLNRVTEPVLNQLLDNLLEHHIINEEEMQSASTKANAEKARHLIDMVRRKGTEASSVLITALLQVDPYLSRALQLS